MGNGGPVYQKKTNPLQSHAVAALSGLIGLVAAIGTTATFFLSDVPNGPAIAFGSLALVCAVLGYVLDPFRTRLVVAAAALGLVTGLGLQTSDLRAPPEAPSFPEAPPPVRSPASFANVRWPSKHVLVGQLISRRATCAAERKVFVEVASDGSAASIATRTNRLGEWRVPHVASSGEVRVRAPSTTRRGTSGKAVTCSAAPQTFIARALVAKRPRVGTDHPTSPVTFGAPSTETQDTLPSTTGAPAPQGEGVPSQSQNETSDAKTGGNDWGDAETVEPLNHE